MLDKGHEIEALARPFAVEFAGVDGLLPGNRVDRPPERILRRRGHARRNRLGVQRASTRTTGRSCWPARCRKNTCRSANRC